MPKIFLMILNMFGWQKLVLMAWNAAYPDMVKAAAKTETQFDDNFLKFANEIIVTITGKPVDVEKPKQLKEVK